ncbi:MAG: fumarylacetoacetate hydrolase family protein [Lysinibacillus sp.]
MKLAVIKDSAYVKTVLVRDEFVYPLERVAKQFDMPISKLIETQLIESLRKYLQFVDWGSIDGRLPIKHVNFAMPQTNFQHIFGIGANYVEKAEDLRIQAEKPVCFLKTSQCLVGPNDVITFPKFSQRVSAEGELALIIGKQCFEVNEDKALDYVAGYTTALDFTAKDLREENQNFLQLSKLFKGSCSIGPVIQFETQNLTQLVVETVRNNTVLHQNTVSNMTYSPTFLVAYISKFVTLMPGDIILTGTPGSFDCEKGDIAECRVTGLTPLTNQMI